MIEKKILVVDDEEAIRNMLETAFTQIGYQVVLAESAEKALVVLKNENIPVMFLDLNLPEMNGMELCQQIRKNNPLAIIHAMTGYISLFELADCREIGFDDYFIKPVNLKILFKAAQDAFEKIQRWMQR